MNLSQIEIVNRHDPCKCGCKGQDPWHARTFTRNIKNATVQPDGLRKGTAKFPWGEETVVERQVAGCHWTWWEISR